MTKNKTQKGFILLHHGPLSLSDMQAATKLAGKDAVIDTDAARLAGADFAFGPPDLLDDLKARLSVSSLEEIRKVNPGLPPEAAEWLATGNRGLSSEAIFQKLFEVDLDSDGDHPRDPADLERCRRLLEAVPGLQDRLHEMREVSPQWAGLVDNWKDLCACMDKEAPDWRDRRGAAGETYERMRDILENAAADGPQF